MGDVNEWTAATADVWRCTNPDAPVSPPHTVLTPLPPPISPPPPHTTIPQQVATTPWDRSWDRPLPPPPPPSCSVADACVCAQLYSCAESNRGYFPCSNLPLTPPSAICTHAPTPPPPPPPPRDAAGGVCALPCPLHRLVSWSHGHWPMICI
jgi:hypothetical protein